VSLVRRTICRAFAARLTSMAVCAVGGLAACGPVDSRTPAPPSTVGATTAAATADQGTCRNTGLWAKCSLLYRLERSGLVPRVDSSATVGEHGLSGTSFVIRLSATSTLDVFLYPDSAARKADGVKLDRTNMVSDSTPLTMRREKTLIESANVIAVLSSLNDRLRERVGNAILAGAPQP
jgi:hypothetical protein